MNLGSEPSTDLLELLTKKVRLVSTRQVAREFFSHCKHPIAAANRQIERLEKIGILQTERAMCHTVMALAGPVFEFEPGGDIPDFNRVAWQLQSRWKEPLLNTSVAFATKKAMAAFGGVCGGRSPRPGEITHDIHVAEVFFRFSRERPDWADAWVSEDVLRKEGRIGEIPDSVIHLSDNDVIIDFGGSYSAAKLKRMHGAFCHTRYQIW